MPKKLNTSSRRKWSHEDCQKVLKYMRINPLQKPTTINYYQNMVKENGFEFDEKVARNKVNNLFKSYKMALSSMAIQQSLPMEDVLNICPYYTQLHEIFKTHIMPRRNTICVERRQPSLKRRLTTIHNKDDENTPDCSSASFRNDITTQSPPEDVTAEPVVRLIPIQMKFDADSADQPSPVARSTGAPTETPVLLNNTYPRIISYGSITPLDNIDTPLQVNHDIPKENGAENIGNDIRSNGHADTLDKTSHTDQAEVNSTKLDIKKMELRLKEKELNIKLLKIKSNERLQRLKIESKERIAMRAMQMKYDKK